MITPTLFQAHNQQHSNTGACCSALPPPFCLPFIPRAYVQRHAVTCARDVLAPRRAQVAQLTGTCQRLHGDQASHAWATAHAHDSARARHARWPAAHDTRNAALTYAYRIVKWGSIQHTDNVAPDQVLASDQLQQRRFACVRASATCHAHQPAYPEPGRYDADSGPNDVQMVSFNQCELTCAIGAQQQAASSFG